MNICTLVNYNLDGVVSEILLSQVFKINSALKCGYVKVNQYLNQGKLYEDGKGQPFDKLVVASFALPHTVFESLSEHYTSSFSLIDHHHQTEYSVANNNYSAKITWDTSKSSAMLIYEAIEKVGKVDVRNFQMLAKAANIYELWDTKNDLWGMAYAMNILFWHYNGFKFVERFINGAKPGTSLIDNDEKAIIRDIITEKQDTIKKGVREVFDNNTSVLYLNVTSDIVSDISLQKENKDMEVLFIVFNNFNGKQTLSIRKSEGYYKNNPLGTVVNNFCKKSSNMSGGGHGNAASITFEQECKLDAIIDIVKYLNDKIKGKTPEMEITFSDGPNYDEDVPF